MSYEDFAANFEKLEICHLGPEVMDEIERMTGSKVKQENWTTNSIEATWVKGRSAGGCKNFISKFKCWNYFLLYFL